MVERTSEAGFVGTGIAVSCLNRGFSRSGVDDADYGIGGGNRSRESLLQKIYRRIGS